MSGFLKHVLFFILFVSFGSKSMAGQLTLGADLIQPFVLGGWNLNGYYYFDNGLVFGWSHGDNLEMSFEDSFAPDPIKDAKASVFTDWSTGPELGYRLGKNWDVRMDFKAHYNRVKFDSNPAPIRYTLYTVGPSVFYNWFPFSADTNGFLVQFSARYWVEVDDDFNDDNFTYIDKNGNTKKHDPRDFWDGGISGFGLNVAFGWAF
jgi:hypothetical protein